MPGVEVINPEGAFYAFPSVKQTGRTSQEIADFLLEEASVAVVPGSAFGRAGEGYLRISYTNFYKQLEEGLENMERALVKLFRM
jgi:aminotransferase